MNILIPVKEKDNNSQLEHILKNRYWAMVNLEEGKVKNINFYEGAWEEIDEFFEVVVVKDKDDYVWPFFEQSIPVLEAPFQNTIEEVMEAFIFKELYEVKM
jgi:predicted Fe-Mo cluster-binding NifX family protein